MKIGPVDPEIIWLKLKRRNLEMRGKVIVEKFGEIGRFLPYRFKSTNF